uniref:Uncharacterized protein n=1 Tax=Arundo donax TaxID=35708 RepID=A0A0A8YCT5_ARUDO
MYLEVYVCAVPLCFWWMKSILLTCMFSLYVWFIFSSSIEK